LVLATKPNQGGSRLSCPRLTHAVAGVKHATSPAASYRSSSASVRLTAIWSGQSGVMCCSARPVAFLSKRSWRGPLASPCREGRRYDQGAELAVPTGCEVAIEAANGGLPLGCRRSRRHPGELSVPEYATSWSDGP